MVGYFLGVNLTFSLPSVLLGAAIACVVGCAGSSSGDEADAGFIPCDGGFEGEGDVLVVDAGECAQPRNLSAAEGEGEGSLTDDPGCATLRTKTCGAADECVADPGCVAADLTARFEPEACSAGIADNRSFPPCTGGSCDRLVVKVCGVACTDAPGCAPAQTLQTRADDGDVSAEASCGSALSDESLFPPCTG